METTQKQWTLEEKLEYVEKIKRWKDELIKVSEKNIYYHPEKHWRPYYLIKEGKFFKHKPYVVKNQTIRYTKNGITEMIHVSSFKPQLQEIENPFFD
jgi:hypothetical protein